MSDYMKAAVKLLERVFLDVEDTTGVLIEGQTFRECQEVIRGLRTELAEYKELRENVEYILDKEDGAVSVREGGGPESLSASLAVTWVKKNEALADKERQLQESWSVRSDLDELAERDEQEPVAYITPYALEGGEANIILAEDVPDANKSRMIPLYRHPPAPAAVPEPNDPRILDIASRMLTEPEDVVSIFEQVLQSAEPASQKCCCENPEPESGVALVSNCCPVHNENPMPCAEPASRSESEIKAEALEELADRVDEAAERDDRAERKLYLRMARVIRAEAARLRGEGSD